MKILLDENLPRKLVAALRTEGHEVESVQTLRLQGVDNGRLFQVAVADFDLCFTRDAGFAISVRQSPAPPRFKLLKVTFRKSHRTSLSAIFFRLSVLRIGVASSTATTGRDSTSPLPMPGGRKIVRSFQVPLPVLHPINVIFVRIGNAH